MTFTIVPADLSDALTHELVSSHVAEMRAGADPSVVYAYDTEQLRAHDVTLWTAWHGDELAGVGGLKHLDEARGELKSFRTARAFLGRGVGRALVRHVIAEGRARGYSSLWLETGTAPSFVAARHLYASEGFTACEAFDDYTPNPLSHFMTRAL